MFKRILQCTGILVLVVIVSGSVPQWSLHRDGSMNVFDLAFDMFFLDNSVKRTSKEPSIITLVREIYWD